MKSETSATFTIDGATHAVLAYQPNENHDPDGESNGSAITVSKDGSRASEPTPTPTPDEPTPTPPPAEGAVHVGDLDGTANVMGKNWEVGVAIAVHDQDHNPVCDATVSGLWSGEYVGTGSCTTDASGRCSVTSSKMKSGTSLTFTVGGVTHTSLDYQPLENHDLDGDSDGTRIAVYKP
jgi:hypothetical protein